MAKIRSPVSFTERFGISPAALDAAGVLNPVLNVDTKLFIDPVLIHRSKLTDFSKAAGQSLRSHFEEVIKLLAVAKTPTDVAWRAAESRLDFPEIASTCLGYGAATIRGHAFGPQLRGQLIRTAKEIVDLVQEAMNFKENLKTFFLISRKVSNTAIGRDVKDALAGYPIPVLDVSIGHRIAFAESAGQGQTVLETLPKGAAAKEIRGLAQSLRKLYGKESVVRHKTRA